MAKAKLTASSVKQLLGNAGFTHVWDNPRSTNLKHVHPIYRINDSF